MDEIWTNDSFLFEELGLKDKKIFLWKVWLRTEEMLSVPNKDFDYAWDRKCLEKMPAWQKAEKIWLVDTEARSYPYFLDDARVEIWDSTLHDDPRMHPYWFWLDWVREVESWQQLGDRMIPAKDKNPDFMFDLLLGRKKESRTKVYDSVISDPMLKDLSLMSYTGQGTHWIPGIEKDRHNDLPEDFKSPLFFNPGNISNSMEGHQVNFHDRQTANLCCFVPWQVYDQSWYTMMVETHHRHVFFSEKIAKPLIARRIFIPVHSFPGTYRVLRKLGFRTFESVIDQSFDDIEDFDLRLSAALDQCRRLIELDPRRVYAEMESVLEHNRRHLLEFREVDRMMLEMKDMIK